MASTAERLMDAAERRMKKSGYHGFSFRGVASEIGITGASAHHHFPTKAGMIAAIMQRCRRRFETLIAPKPGESGQGVIVNYGAVFRGSLEDERSMCLSAMLGAESGGLPPELADGIERFFRFAADDLASRLDGPDAERRASSIVAALESGLILARACHDIDAFDRATSSLVAFSPISTD